LTKKDNRKRKFFKKIFSQKKTEKILANFRDYWALKQEKKGSFKFSGLLEHFPIYSNSRYAELTGGVGTGIAMQIRTIRVSGQIRLG
jgi:hypothetical protein